VLSSKTEIEMWGDGKQTRSFTYIDDCVEGILRVTKSDFREPLNLGSCEMVSMNEMMEMAMTFEEKVRGRGNEIFTGQLWSKCGPEEGVRVCLLCYALSMWSPGCGQDVVILSCESQQFAFVAVAARLSLTGTPLSLAWRHAPTLSLPCSSLPPVSLPAEAAHQAHPRP
jgi:hypothetical protein